MAARAAFILMDMEDIIITTPDRLQAIVHNAVRSVLPELATYMSRDREPESDNLDGAQAASDFLTQQGFNFTRASVYGLVHQERIPYCKFGRKTVFSKKSLIEWAKSQMKSTDKRAEAVLQLAKSARRKNSRK